MGIVIFAVIMMALAGGYTLFIRYKGGPSYVESESGYADAGSGIASVAIIALVSIYGRSVLKLLVNEGSFWDRLGEIVDPGPARTWSKKLLKVLTATHPYAGVVAVGGIYLHCLFTGKALDNLLLTLLLIVMGFQGITGLILKFKYTPRSMKRLGFLLHLQFYIGIAIVVLAIFGHAMVGD